MGAAAKIFDETTRAVLRLVAEAKGPGIDYPPPSLAHGKGGPDQMFIWNRMIKRHAPSGWGAAVNIYKNSAKKHGIEPFGSTSTLPMAKAAAKKKSKAVHPVPAVGGKKAGGSSKDAGYTWLQSHEGQKAMGTLMKGMMKHMKDTTDEPLGFNDVRSALTKWLGKTRKAS